MATKNTFDLLINDDGGEDSFVIIEKVVAGGTKGAAAAALTPTPTPAKLPTKPAPPAQAVRESRNNSFAPRGGATSRGGTGRGRGYQGGGRTGGQNLKSGNGEANGYGGKDGVVVPGEGEVNRSSDRGRGPRQPYRGRHGGYANGEAGDESGSLPRRMYDRHSGTGRGYEMKREGAGRRNWGTMNDDKEAVEMGNAEEKTVVVEEDKEKERQDGSAFENAKDKEGAANGEEEKEPEDKEMTLEEYERLVEDKRKALLALKTEERKVEIDKELQSMQLLSVKKDNDEVFIKLGSDKELKKKENAEKDERAKKSLSINEFLKPAEGERYYSPGGRGRGRGKGRGERGESRGGYGGSTRGLASTPAIEDQAQFPTLGGK